MGRSRFDATGVPDQHVKRDLCKQEQLPVPSGGGQVGARRFEEGVGTVAFSVAFIFDTIGFFIELQKFISSLTLPVLQGTTHGRTFRPHHRVAVVVEPWDGQDPPSESTGSGVQRTRLSLIGSRC